MLSTSHLPQTIREHGWGRLVVAETTNQAQTEVGPDPDTNQTKTKPSTPVLESGVNNAGCRLDCGSDGSKA